MEVILGIIGLPFVLALLIWLPSVEDDEDYSDDDYDYEEYYE